MKKKDELLDHNYDGIQEYDNDLPRWWIALFWIGIVFGFIYIGIYHIGSADFTTEKIALKMQEIKDTQLALKADEPKAEDMKASLLKLVSNEEAISAGKELYVAKCAACHLAQGQGLVGPNLTDDYWIHGGDITDIHSVLVNGVVEKGMIAWGPLLSADEINQLTAFVWTLHGTTPPNPKEPQGEFIERASITETG